MIKRFLLLISLLQLSCVSLARIRSNPTEGNSEPTPTHQVFSSTPSATGADLDPSNTPFLSDAERRREEYAIYPVILTEFYLDDQIQCFVLEDFTTTGHLAGADESRAYIQENMPGVSDDLWMDFDTQNQESIPVSSSFEVGVPVILISEEDVAKLFSTDDGGGWDRFYETFAGAQGIMELSRVGFNHAMDRALVYTGNQSHYLAGAGHLFLMEKRDGRWTIQETLMVWIS
jgi:hypothetical protein